MTRLWFLVVATSAFLGSLLCIQLARPVVLPDLWVEHPVFDHGELSQGQEVQTTFKLVNHFPQPLDIREVVTGCSCSQGKLSATHLEPDEEVSLKVSWKTGRSRGRTGTNLQVDFQFADGATGYKILRIQGDVVPDIHYDPGEVLFVTEKAATKAVQFSPGRKKDFTLQKAFCNHAAFCVALQTRNQVRVTFQPEKWDAQVRSEPRLVVETDGSNEPQLVIPLKVVKQTASE